jgi:MFS transporter, MHS family, alpha-ketoglutarate permease
VVKAELFTTEMRTVGVAIPYSIARAVFGGATAYIALALRDAGHENYFVIYVSVCAGISMLTYVFMPETRDVDLVATTEIANPFRPRPNAPTPASRQGTRQWLTWNTPSRTVSAPSC